MSDTLTGTDRTAAIIAEMWRRWPCQEIPTGGLTELGKQFGVTRERIRQIANRAGFGRHRKKDHRPVRVCASCGVPLIDRGPSVFCKEHQFFTLPCAQCGEPRRIAARDFTSRFTAPSSRYQTVRVFCDRKCTAAWKKGKPRAEWGQQ